MNVKAKRVVAAMVLGTVSVPALGYVGPGAGLTLLSALWGLLLAVAVALGFVLMWPIRRWRRRRQAALQQDQQTAATDDETDVSERGWTDR